MRICVASSEFLGPFSNGGIGTAYTKLGEALNGAGHDVTFLYTQGYYTHTAPIVHWIEVYRQRGIRFVPLPESPVNLSSLSPNLATSHRVFLWLREHDGFDVVHFPEYGGSGYHSVLAKHQGLILRRTTTVVGLHGSSRWARSANEQLSSSGKDLEDDFIERRAAELADIVWSPGRYMLDWARQHGWNLERRCHLQPYVVPISQRQAPTSPISELVFFGRQEVRKGLFLFLDAIDQLVETSESRDIDDLVVTILGKPTPANGEDSEQVIRDRSRRWPFPTQILSDRNHEQAIEYLQGEGALAIIPSIVENYPNTVLECLAFEVPFLASRVGSIPEQIHPDDVDRVCFDPTPRRLAERLQRVLREGHAPARLSFDPEQNTRAWVRWHERLLGVSPGITEPSSIGNGRTRAVDPTVSVCLAHYNRPHFLRQALDSIVNQDSSPLEVIVVDDGSPSASVQQELEAIALQYDFAGRGWRLVRQENRYLGAARNRAAAEAKGDYLLFMDDDNVAKPHEISTFTAVARHTGADVLTCLMDMFHGEQAPGIHMVPSLRWLCPGPNLPLCVFYNTFGDANAIIRRTAFQSVGGFTEDYGIGHEDWELFARLLLKGYHVEVVPEALFWYRVMPESMIKATSVKRNFQRSLRPHLEQIPEPYHQLIEMCLGRSLIDRGFLASDGQAPSPAIAGDSVPAWPLRYKIVDGLNARLKQFSQLHRVGKQSIQGILQVRRRMIKR
jgi:glycosyltransferase involved in cell wall biosynthesis